MSRALIVTDVQNDFCEGGSLAVHGGAEVAASITEYIRLRGGDYAVVVATRDHHVDPGSHFADEPDFRDSWPHHCVVGTAGAEFHPALDPAPFAAVFDKGERAAAYSGFEGRSETGEDLATYLRSRGIEAVDVVGIATDHCVRATALDAVAAGFDTRVLVDLCAGVLPDTTTAAIKELEAAGVEVTTSP